MGNTWIVDLRHYLDPSGAFADMPTPARLLEPISKLFKQDAEGRKLYEAEEIGRVVFPADQETTLPLNPRKEALDGPAALVPTQSSTVLRLALFVGAVRRDHFRSLLAHRLIKLIAVV